MTGLTDEQMGISTPRGLTDSEMGVSAPSGGGLTDAQMGIKPRGLTDAQMGVRPAGLTDAEMGTGPALFRPRNMAEKVVGRNLPTQPESPEIPASLVQPTPQYLSDPRPVKPAAGNFTIPPIQGPPDGREPSTREAYQHDLSNFVLNPSLTPGERKTGMKLIADAHGVTVPTELQTATPETRPYQRTAMDINGAINEIPINAMQAVAPEAIQPLAEHNRAVNMTPGTGYDTAVKSVAKVAPLVALPGAGATIVAGVTGAGAVRGDIAERRARGEKISPEAEAAAATGQGLLDAGMMKVGLGTGEKAAERVAGGVLRKSVAAIPATAAEMAPINVAANTASNVIAKATYDPNRDVMHGTKEALIGAAATAIPLGIAGAVHSTRADHSPTAPPTPESQPPRQPAQPEQSAPVPDVRETPALASEPSREEPGASPEIRPPQVDNSTSGENLPKPDVAPTAVNDAKPDANSVSPPKTEQGFVRMYHGGSEPDGGPRWLSPDLEYAKGYAEKNGGKVYSVDVPEDSPLLTKSFDDTGTDVKAPYNAFNAPPEIAKNLKAVDSGQPSQEAAPPTPEQQIHKMVADELGLKNHNNLTLAEAIRFVELSPDGFYGPRAKELLKQLKPVDQSALPPSEPPATTPDAEPHYGPPPDSTSARKVQMAGDREAMGLSGLDSPARRSWQTALDTAQAQGVPDRAMRIAAEVNETPRSLSDVETAGLVVHATKLKSEHAALTEEIGKATDPADIQTKAAEANRIEQEFDTLSQALRSSGTEKGRALASQKLTLNSDYQLVTVLNRAKTAKGGDLKPAERAQFDTLTKRLEETTTKLAEVEKQSEQQRVSHEAALREARAQASHKKTVADVRREAYGARNRIVNRDAYEKAKKEWLSTSTTGTVIGATAQKLTAAAQIAAYHVEAGARSFGSFSRRMIADLGEDVRPHINDLYKKALAQIGKDEKSAITESLKGKLEKGGEVVGANVQSLARAFVREGVTEREPLIDAVHGELKKIDPKITREQTMDAISGYGDYKKLSRDEIDVQLRDLKGQMQQLGKLRDLEAKIPPKKTGVERREPSQSERNLIKQVNDLKKTLGIQATDPETQLRSTLDGIKTRLKNEIADLNTQITSGVKSVREKSPVPYDAEAQGLRQQRDAVKSQYDQIFGREGLTDAQRIKLASGALDRSIAKLESDLKTGNIYPGKPASKTPVTPELQAKRAQLEQLRNDRQALRAQDTPTIIENRRTELQSQIKALGERIAKGDFSRPARSEPTTSPELERLAYQRDRLRKQINERIQDMKPKSIWSHIAEPFNAARAIMTSMDLSAVFRQGGIIAIAHPARAAKSIAPMLRAFASDQYAHRINNEILNRPNAPLYARSKLYLAKTESAGLGAREEFFMSRWVKKIPGVSGSERAYTTFLNKLRADSFDTMTATLARNGEPTQAEATAVANYINVATGRGGLGSFESAAVGLNTAFFAPRYTVSRFQFLAQPLTGFRYGGGSGRTRVMIAKEYGKYLAGLGVVYALGVAAGGKVEEDPRSSDFGKIRFGNTRLDPLSGLSQTASLGGKLSTGERKTGDATQSLVAPKYGQQDALGVMGRFIRSKLSPAAATTVDVVSRKQFDGTPATPKNVAQNLSIPLSFKDIYNAMQDQGVPRGTALGLLSLFGMGLQTYGSDRLSGLRAEKRQAKDDGQPFINPELKILEHQKKLEQGPKMSR